MNDRATDEWAKFVIHFAVRGPENGENISPLIEAILLEACGYADRNKLDLDAESAALVREIQSHRKNVKPIRPRKRRNNLMRG